METKALEKLPIIIPIKSKEVCDLAKIEKNNIMAPKTIAPINALERIPKFVVKIDIPVMMDNATNKLDPVLIPRMFGPANGLLNKFCISNPATESPAPESIAIDIRGKRKSRMMM